MMKTRTILLLMAWVAVMVAIVMANNPISVGINRAAVTALCAGAWQVGKEDEREKRKRI